jgi:hypothetical protein
MMLFKRSKDKYQDMMKEGGDSDGELIGVQSDTASIADSDMSMSAFSNFQLEGGDSDDEGSRSIMGETVQNSKNSKRANTTKDKPRSIEKKKVKPTVHKSQINNDQPSFFESSTSKTVDGLCDASITIPKNQTSHVTSND